MDSAEQRQYLLTAISDDAIKWRDPWAEFRALMQAQADAIAARSDDGFDAPENRPF